jgi:hypothetical protein
VAVDNFIIVGPKKTGTTTFYEWLKSSYTGPQIVLKKELNGLYDKSENYLREQYTKGVIEVCPDYFSDFRAHIRLRSLQENYDLKFTIVILDREPYARMRSHVSYMLHEGIITPSLKEPEVNTIVLQSMGEVFRRIWINDFDVRIFDMSDIAQVNSFTTKYLGQQYSEQPRENVTTGAASITKKAVFRPIAAVLRKYGAPGVVEAVRKFQLVQRLSTGSSGSTRTSEIDTITQRVYKLTLDHRSKISDTLGEDAALIDRGRFAEKTEPL